MLIHATTHSRDVSCNLKNQNENIAKLFIKAHSEFIQTKKSEKSVEALFDLIYLIRKKESSEQENYVLANLYSLLGKNIDAQKVIEKGLKGDNKKVIQKLLNLQKEIDKQKQWHRIKEYRDLRDSKFIKKPSKIKKSDFVISKEERTETYHLKFSDTKKEIVILNKNVKIGNDYLISSKAKPDEFLFLLIEEHIEWLAKLKNEFLTFYNNNEFEYKFGIVDQNWFDAINVWDFQIEINENLSLVTNIYISDYLQDDFGFRLEIIDKTIQEIEYDPIL